MHVMVKVVSDCALYSEEGMCPVLPVQMGYGTRGDANDQVGR